MSFKQARTGMDGLVEVRKGPPAYFFYSPFQNILTPDPWNLRNSFEDGKVQFPSSYWLTHLSDCTEFF